ncbi:phasin family protein [Roseovarius nanhaiticus]|uniref:Phasin protein n=1 Tax=Roseovarius nanhaiticus TaxID=573024 RepID=A0A1N7FSZ5_9RHOB|nr:phasin family protein [Roseovarius nanhaiticus]SEK46406.1 Phasin protein [Roseovarius nanhaiticus]SIS03375.1 Phasin protein [Roseovarius nanhaiticus]
MSGSQKADATQPPQTDLMKAMRDAGLKAMPNAAMPLFEAMSEMGSQMLTFTAERIRKDVETQHALLHAKTFAEIQHLQAQFFQQALEDYIAETSKLMEMSRTLAPKAPGDAQD